jgi:hypothetical protein
MKEYTDQFPVGSHLKKTKIKLKKLAKKPEAASIMLLIHILIISTSSWKFGWHDGSSVLVSFLKLTQSLLRMVYKYSASSRCFLAFFSKGLFVWQYALITSSLHLIFMHW